ncbi:hypothetical protein RFI_05279 [Reticulomyxa filosa]|uniref:Uncharacterized protein n=1 Tax=Reticulomyxa filosa TaxID=46433 RepID=X6P124_RETFI|nr:hypothetical protein RFI_05279 [Reticulomyxa filosa]|eukprot:ETO31833.1 hypothetical protein RFI_05279 [Reticulomyxa filosa]
MLVILCDLVLKSNFSYQDHLVQKKTFFNLLCKGVNYPYIFLSLNNKQYSNAKLCISFALQKTSFLNNKERKGKKAVRVDLPRRIQLQKFALQDFKKTSHVRIFLKSEWSGYGLKLDSKDPLDKDERRGIRSGPTTREIIITSEAPHAINSAQLHTGKDDHVTLLCMQDHSCEHMEILSDASRNLLITQLSSTYNAKDSFGKKMNQKKTCLFCLFCFVLSILFDIDVFFFFFKKKKKTGHYNMEHGCKKKKHVFFYSLKYLQEKNTHIHISLLKQQQKIMAIIAWPGEH